MMKKSIYAAFLLLMAFWAAAEMVSLPEKTSVTTPLFQFDDGERWVVESYGGETVLTPGNSGLEVNGQGHSIRIRNRKFQLLRYHSLTGFSLKLQILEGKGNVIPVWKGADGKLVRLAPRPFAPGNATLRWEAEPVWQAGTVYEVSYGSTGLPDAGGNTIIGVLWRAWA